MLARFTHRGIGQAWLKSILAVLMMATLMIVLVFTLQARQSRENNKMVGRDDSPTVGGLLPSETVLPDNRGGPLLVAPTYVVCEPPCWRGIVPGKSTSEQAQELVENYPGYERTEWAKDDGRVVVQHAWSSGGTDSRFGWNTIRSTKNGIVEDINLYYEGPNYTLQDLVNLFGPPAKTSSALFSVHDAKWSIYFLYAEKGLLFGTDFENLNAHTRVIYRSYFAPSTADKYMDRTGNRSFSDWNPAWWSALSDK